MMSTYIRLLSTLVWPVIVGCVVWLLVTVVVILLARCWIQRRAPRQFPHLRTPVNESPPLCIGFFHPYCNAGGGGERVLWVAIRALQNRYSHVRCVVYTGDIDTTREGILSRASDRFNIHLPRTDPSSLDFVWLKRREWVEARSYPIFTLLGQSIGSVWLGLEALFAFVPDIYLDTMGYAFTVPLFKYIGGCKTGCYVHYPTISTDMLDRVSQRTRAHNNASFISQSSVLSYFKLVYYRLFAYAYGTAGKRCDIVMVNSSWTEGHILQLWCTADRTHVVYPPCDTNQFLAIPLDKQKTKSAHSIISVAQFRPEKDHELQLKVFHDFVTELDGNLSDQDFTLVLVGGCRNEEDQKRVKSLKELAQRLDVSDKVEFCLNVPFAELKQRLAEATVGLHTMWNEHFGIGVVEMMAAGVITLAHNSGGPKLDIVTEHQSNPTGFLADSVETYVASLKEIFSMSADERSLIRTNARESVGRFSEQNFESTFLNLMENII